MSTLSFPLQKNNLHATHLQDAPDVPLAEAAVRVGHILSLHEGLMR